MSFLHDHRRRVPPQLHSSRNGDRQKTPGSCGFSCLRSRIPEAVGGIAEYAKSQGGRSGVALAFLLALKGGVSSEVRNDERP